MKVLIINSVCEGGSTGKIVSDLYTILKKNGHECKIAYGLGKNKKSDDFIKFNNKFGYYIHNVLGKLTDGVGKFSILQTKYLIHRIKKFNPDIIHLHHVHGYYINYEILFRYFKKSNIHVVWTLHDCWAFTGHCTYFSNIVCDKWKQKCYKCKLLNQYPKSYFVDNSKSNYLNKKKFFTLPENLTIITPSKWLASQVKSSFLSKYHIRVINNGINLDIFKPTKCNLGLINNINKKIILGVSNVWTKEKGFDDFMKLAKIINNDYQIVMVGLSQEQIEKLPLNIIGIKRTSNQKELASIYSSAFVFLNLTYEDNYPTVNLEAQACGCPIITYNTDGSPEAVFKEHGYVIDKGNVKKVYDTIHKIVPSDEIAKKSKIFDCKIAYSKYIDLYNNILKK